MFDFFRRRGNQSAKIQNQIDEIKNKIESVQNEIRARASYEGIGLALETLGQKSLKDQHNPNYLGERFRDYELALLNVKQMGFYLARKEAESTGFFDNSNFSASKEKLLSKLCTQSDCDSSWFKFWMREMHCAFTYHRKMWEFAYIAQQLYAHGALEERKRGVGFGCGEEPLPSLFAKYGATVVATDLGLEETLEQGHGWVDCGQHSASLEKVLDERICPDPEKLARISHEPANMNHIPSHFNNDFDFCWSACALEHIGSIELGMSFIENSMKTLRPGGIAVHTTEYNLEDGPTIDNSPTVLFQREHMGVLKQRLEDKGYVVAPFDLNAGNGLLDGLFDIPPWPWDVAKLSWQMQDCMMHLKRSIGGFACTSVAITVLKPA